MPDVSVVQYKHPLQFDIGGTEGEAVDDPEMVYVKGTAANYQQIHIEPIREMGCIKFGIDDTFCFIQAKQARTIAEEILRRADEAEGK